MIELSDFRYIYCFGAGKYFKTFIEQCSGISVCAVIDNYSDHAKVSAFGKLFPIVKLDNVIPGKNTVIVITSLHAREMIEQIVRVDSLSDVSVTVAPSVCEALGVSEESLLVLLEHSNGKNSCACFEKPCKGFQVYELLSESPIAGSKALSDVHDIAACVGYRSLNVHISDYLCDETQEWKRRRSREEYKNIYETVTPGAVLLLQHPFRYSDPARNECLLMLKHNKDVKFISVVHDAEILRNLYMTDYLRTEFSFMIENSDIMIVHNDIMKKEFIRLGISEEKLLSLDIFDYLAPNEKSMLCSKANVIVYAGNLSQEKSPFLSKLNNLPKMDINLFGINYSEELMRNNRNVKYHGAVSADRLPDRLNEGFGLVWDGDSIDTCRGETGKYLLYNNPHKLSLYLASGLPVIVWKEAACASFVSRTGVGIMVESLEEIPTRIEKVTDEDYHRWAQNAAKIGMKLRTGEYTKAAIREAEQRLLAMG